MPQTAQEAGFERAKGAGEVEDAADALWRYVRSQGGRGAARVLAVESRGGSGLDETIVHFDPDFGRLSLGEGDRRDAADAARRSKIRDVLARHGRLNTNQLAAKAGGNRNDMLVRWPETFTGSAEALSCLRRGG